MRNQFPWLKERTSNWLNFFEQSAYPNVFGLGQFVLLLTLSPFIFDLSLYSFGETKQVPSHYEFPADRFESLPSLLAEDAKKSNNKPPSPSYKHLNSYQKKQLYTCNHYPLHQLFYANYCNNLRKKHSQLNRDNQRKKNAYQKKLNAYNAFTADRNKQIKKVKQQYNQFDKDAPKPALISESIEIKQYSNNSMRGLINKELTSNDWQKITLPLWLLGALLIFPAVVFCIKRRFWGLLTLGLLVPTLNYCFAIPSILFGLESIAHWKIVSTLFPQAGFLWFALRGKIRSKSYTYFLLLLLLLSLFASLTNSDASFSFMQALLPLLVFITASSIVRLLVKIIKHNRYWFKNLGWKKSIQTIIRSILLWLPLGLLATPFFYMTEIVIPKHLVNHLYANNLLVFNHQHDILDNALQSTAVQTDDAMYNWYLITQGVKKDIHRETTKLEEIDLKKSIAKNFDEVFPKELEFDEYTSDAGFIKKGIVELSVGASQATTNQAYKKLRSKIRKQLLQIVVNHDTDFKDAVKNTKSKTLSSIDELYAKGQDALLETNDATQTSLWWTINYAIAAHQLTILLFIFFCIKSLMYVFSRVSFSKESNAFITLGQLPKEADNHPLATKSQIKPTGLQYLIDPEKEETFYISRRFQCRGKAPKYTIPQPFHVPIARLFNSAYSMNKVVMHKGNDKVSCSASQGIEFFEWTLNDGESIIFDFHNFVGMSDSIKVSTLISTRISSLLIGKMIYSQATGPGKLILMAKGRAEITDSIANGGSLPAERIIAMQTNTRLEIDSEIDLVNIYLSTAYVRPAGGGQAIIDVDSQRGTKTGLGSFLKRFIFPG